MHERYVNEKIAKIFSDDYKLWLWQKTELAVIEAKVNLGLIAKDVFSEIKREWEDNPIDHDWWKAHDKRIHHDLNAFIAERLRHLSKKLHQHVHEKITSYDTEESAFIRILILAMDVVNSLYHELEESLKNLAIAHRYTIMNARTHGQEAELQSFGARVLTWLKDLRVVYNALYRTRENLRYSKLSGAIGKYGSIDPKVEKETLRILGFEPFYGSTQIMPRALYAPIADALCYLALVVDKIANDIRLAARSGNPLMQEPFGKKQTGSSAMPHKKNPIRLEGIEGNAAMAQGYALMITNCIKTWEERAIHQSRVERVGWPDLFHVVVNSLETLNGVIKGLKVYPDNMLEEVYKSRGVYASSEVKESLKKHLCTENFGLDHEDVYRIVQLACFNVFEPLPERENIRNTIASSLEQSVELLKKLGRFVTNNSMVCSIEEFIPLGALRVSKQLDINEERIREYNDALRKLFHCDDGSFRGDVMDDWHELFTPGFLLKNETVLYKEILGLES